MIRVYKYTIHASPRFVIRMPAGAKPLSVQMQNGVAYLWAQVDTEQPEVDALFGVFGTGHDMPGLGEYIGTFQMHGGQLVFHLFRFR